MALNKGDTQSKNIHVQSRARPQGRHRQSVLTGWVRKHTQDEAANRLCLRASSVAAAGDLAAMYDALSNEACERVGIDI